MLDSGSITEHDNQMFCNACYRLQSWENCKMFPNSNLMSLTWKEATSYSIYGLRPTTPASQNVKRTIVCQKLSICQTGYFTIGQYLRNPNCRKNFGPKGYGFGGGAGTLSMDDGKGYKTNPNEVRAFLQSLLIIENQYWVIKDRFIWLEQLG